MSSNYVSALISLGRAIPKVAKGDKVKCFTTVGSAVKVVEKLAKIDNSWGQGARNVLDTFSAAAEKSPALQTLGKGVDLAKKSDEIGMGMSVIQVAKSSSPARKLIEEALGWTTKFATKRFMLKKLPNIVQNTKGVSTIANKITEFSKNTKGLGQVPAIISGVAYSLATIYVPKFARQAGNWLADKMGIKPYEEAPANKTLVKNA